MSKKTKFFYFVIGFIIISVIIFVLIFNQNVNQKISQESPEIIKETIDNSLLESQREFEEIRTDLSANNNDGFSQADNSPENTKEQPQTRKEIEDFVIKELSTGEKLLEIKDQDRYLANYYYKKVYFPDTNVIYNGRLFLLKESADLYSFGSKVTKFDSFRYKNENYWVYLFAENFDTLSLYIAKENFENPKILKLGANIEFIDDFVQLQDQKFKVFYLEGTEGEKLTNKELIVDFKKYLNDKTDYITKLESSSPGISF